MYGGIFFAIKCYNYIDMLFLIFGNYMIKKERHTITV